MQAGAFCYPKNQIYANRSPCEQTVERIELHNDFRPEKTLNEMRLRDAHVG